MVALWEVQAGVCAVFHLHAASQPIGLGVTLFGPSICSSLHECRGRCPRGMRQMRNAFVLPGLLSQMPNTCPAVYTVAVPGALPVDEHARYGRNLSLCHRGHWRALACRSPSRMLTDG